MAEVRLKGGKRVNQEGGLKKKILTNTIKKRRREISWTPVDVLMAKKREIKFVVREMLYNVTYELYNSDTYRYDFEVSKVII